MVYGGTSCTGKLLDAIHIMVTIHPLFHQHVSVKMEALVVVTHALVYLGTQEHFAPLALLHALLVISLTTSPAAVMISVSGVCVCFGCGLSDKKH